MTLSDTDFSSVIPNSITISNSFNDADAAKVVNAILGGFYSRPKIMLEA